MGEVQHSDLPLLIPEASLSERQPWQLVGALTTLGRWPDNDIVLPERFVSRYHAQLRCEARHCILTDRQS